MFCWRITKYNPLYRNKYGQYTKDEWTSFFDIGNTYNNQTVTFEEYLQVENAYINAIFAFINCTQTLFLQINFLEKSNEPNWNKKQYTHNMQNMYKRAINGLQLNHQEIELVARLILHEALWCKLENEKMFIHFGWDYYMYIGTNQQCQNAIKTIQKTELFVEPFQSPYL